MNSQPLYKVVLRYGALSAEAFAKTVGYPVAGAVLEFVTDKNREIAWPRYEEAMDWLRDNDRIGHYLNVYDNTDHLNGDGLMVFVLTDRTTAIMLKLALA